MIAKTNGSTSIYGSDCPSCNKTWDSFDIAAFFSTCQYLLSAALQVFSGKFIPSTCMQRRNGSSIWASLFLMLVSLWFGLGQRWLVELPQFFVKSTCIKLIFRFVQLAVLSTSGVHVAWSDSGGAAISARLPHKLESVMSASKCLCLPGGQSTDGRSMGSTKFNSSMALTEQMSSNFLAGTC